MKVAIADVLHDYRQDYATLSQCERRIEAIIESEYIPIEELESKLKEAWRGAQSRAVDCNAPDFKEWFEQLEL